MAQSLATGVCLHGGRMGIHQPAATPRAPRRGDTGLHRRAACVCGAVTTRANKSLGTEALHVTVQPDASDAWRLDVVAELLLRGGVGVIPTDTLTAIVCDVEDRAAVARLYAIKEVANPLTKPLSLLCRGLDDVAKYTQGLPGGGGPGAPNLFRIANAVLPGPYTLLLPASKALPKNCVLDKRGAPVCKLRRTVGVRLPAHPVTAALLARLSRPLLCTSVDWAVDTQAGTRARNAAKLDFVVAVDALHREEAPGVPLPSTVIDLSTGMPRLLRQGAGDWEPWNVDGAEDCSSEPFDATEDDDEDEDEDEDT